MLTPEIIVLCKQASVEQDVGRLLYFVTEINRLIAIRDEEQPIRFASICNPEPEDQSQILKSRTLVEAGPECASGIESR
jgi:hypothetical protein